MEAIETITFRQLPIEFEGKGEVKGYLFKQVFQNDGWFIYQVGNLDKVSHFEVFRKKERVASAYAKENYIAYPKSNAFGIWAWTAKTFEAANKIIESKTLSAKDHGE